MRKSISFTILFLTLLVSSCKKDKIQYTVDEFIVAGKKAGPGIKYVDLNPDIHCYIVEPWENTDTIYYLDLNKDGIDDFQITGKMCHPMFLGGDCETLKIKPLLNNAICIDPSSGYLDTIPYNDTLDMNSNWSGAEALIYSYDWVMGNDTIIMGHWQNVTTLGQYYIGFKIEVDKNLFYGWIGMKRDPLANRFSFFITDYAILKKYDG